MNKKWDRMLRVLLLAAVAATLCFWASCAEQEEEAGPGAAPTGDANSAGETASAPQEAAAEPADMMASAMEQAKQEAEKQVDAAKEEVAAKVNEAASGKKLVEIDFNLPKPMFVGTPQDTKVENLEKPLGHARPPFLAPQGTENVAMNKPVSSSDEFPIIGEIDMITDGDKEAADGSYVELGPFQQHVTIDLEDEYNIHAIVVWHYHKQPRVYFDVVAQVSNDPDFITDVKTVFNNDIDNSAGLGIGEDMHYTETNEGKLIDTLSQGSPKARYVRLYSNGNTSNDLNHYIEVDVYGTPAE